MSDKNEVVVYEPQVISPDEKKGKEMAREYFLDNKVQDFTAIPREVKLALLQITHPKFIKRRDVGNTKIPYIDHFYAEKCLNFIFNFEVSSEMVAHEFRQVKVKTKNGMQDAWEAEVHMRFTFGSGEKKIARDVYSSHKGFENPATTRGDTLKSAVSKAWSVVARTFGVGTNLVEMERKAYAMAEKAAEKTTKKEEPKPATESKTKKAWEK